MLSSSYSLDEEEEPKTHDLILPWAENKSASNDEFLIIEYECKIIGSENELIY